MLIEFNSASKILQIIKLISVGSLFIGSIAILGMSCSKTKLALGPPPLEEQTTVTLRKGDLNVTFVNNEAFGSNHKTGYNGIALLYHQLQDSTTFVPAYAGFNLEHIFGGDSLAELFEPRKHPMSLFKVSEDEVLLYQAPTPLSKVESLTRFKLVAPHYIDVDFRFVAHNLEFFKHDYVGFFWASYIDAPKDKKINFLGSTQSESSKEWIAAYSEKHGVKSTHLGKNDPGDVFFATNFNARLANHYSNYKFEVPYYFGRYHNMALAYFFDASEVIRFSQSPTGGGLENPAWDFQYIVPGAIAGKEYSFRARMVYKEFSDREDITKEFQSWIR